MVLDSSLPERARRLWAEVAGIPTAFRSPGVEVVTSATSSLSPPGWVGVVLLGDAALVAAPDDRLARTVREALGGLSVAAVTDPAALRARLPVRDVLGPASLAYCDATRFRPAVGATETIPGDHPALRALVAAVPAADAGEASLDEITSPAFVVRIGTEVVAAAGYRVWPGDGAHLSVLTALRHRGQGFARMAAAAAVADALAADLLPQWRARPMASRRVAQALGFCEFGSQISVRLSPAGS